MVRYVRFQQVMRVLWPAKFEHTVWTEDEELQAIVIDGPPERDVQGQSLSPGTL